MFANQKITSLLLAVVAVFLNLFQPGLSAAKGFTTPELTAQIGITIDQNDRDNTSDDPEPEDLLPISFANQEVLPLIGNGSQTHSIIKATDSYRSIQVRAPPFNLV
ncbi:hypothetical protein [Neptunicella sp. SCSIO 80796]|uniref:hypothetical protein n=1 Tax=Neptunicella plasticusilytica TaxID=3117012 RepID=UPI003A4D87EB